MSSRFTPSAPALHPASDRLSISPAQQKQISTPSSTPIIASNNNDSISGGNISNHSGGAIPSRNAGALSASPRNNQALRSQHKNSRKFGPSRNSKPVVNMSDAGGFPDSEAALAEQVRWILSYAIFFLFWIIYTDLMTVSDVNSWARSP